MSLRSLFGSGYTCPMLPDLDTNGLPPDPAPHRSQTLFSAGPDYWCPYQPLEGSWTEAASLVREVNLDFHMLVKIGWDELMDYILNFCKTICR